jgi:phosphatidylserine decarboxylase
LALTLLVLSLDALILTCVFGSLTLFVLFFFRDPNRKGMVDEDVVLTPADGKIMNIKEIEGAHNPLGVDAVRVSVFMSVFNVHVNRIPAGGKILKIIYQPGKFFSANLEKASSENENNRILIETAKGQQIMVVQIAGLIARRIACWIREGDTVRAGQRFGLIRFGSRVDLYLPVGSRIKARPCQKVRAGETILGYLP